MKRTVTRRPWISTKLSHLR